MSNERFYVTGIAKFVNLTKHEEYQGQSTGKYSIVVGLTEDGANQLADQGVKLRDYQGSPQRKFASQYNIRLVDADKKPMQAAELTYGSTVRVMYELGKPSPQYGVSPYAVAVQVLELNELSDDEGEF